MSAPPSSTRPGAHLAAILRKYPGLARLVDSFRAGRGNDLPDWPEWCFVPLAAWHAVAMQDATPIDYLESAGDIATLGALAPWRYTQGIYNFDDALLDALADTPLDNILPAQVFLRLPQWSIYITLPPKRFLLGGQPLHGFFASLEWDAGDENRGRQELRLLLDSDRLVPVPLHLGMWTVQESLRRVAAEAQRVAALHGLAAPAGADAYARDMAATITPLLNLLLYLCADAPEIDSEREPGTSPHNPEPRRVKTGVRLYPPDAPTLWRVGDALGAQLRTAGVTHGEPSDGERRSPRVHIRRAHWHGYWTGPRTTPDARGFVYHWLPPLVVGGE